ncbi:TPA: hypothetical protein EYP70_03010 [Candidatus Bathyarchaeota archaeon]|nr:hypothetical protein [Candidatus Bathyarchaeota archaeon]
MLQYWDPKEKREIIRWGTVEHSYAGLQCILIGDNIARYFIWNGIRGIDYLISRKEVDEERIGVTGNSGGGTQTAYLMMVEPRVKVAVPCSYITSLNMLLKTIGPQDAEQNIFGAIKVGLNHDDFLAAFAPKPVLIGVSAYDFFPIEGTLQTLRRTKRIYSLYNAEENVAICVGKHAHMYSDELREAAINWFKVHLKGEPPNFRVKPVTVELEESLRATKSGQVIEEYPDAKTIYNLNVEHYLEKRPLRLKVENEKDLERYLGRLRLELADLLDIKKRKETIYPRIYSTIKFDGYAVEKIFFFSEPGITLTSMMFYKDDVGDEAPPVLALFEDGTNDIAEKSEFIKRILDKGKKILVLDVRGTGGVKVRRVSPYDESYGFKWSKGTEFKLSYTCFLLGSSLLGMRVFDVLRCIDYLKLRRDLNFDELQIYGEGRAALYGFFAAILHPEVKHITLKNMLYSYENLLKTRIYSRRYGEDMMVYGILKHFDIVDLLPSLHKRDYKFVNLRNAKDEIVTVEDLERDWLQVIEKYYPLLGDIRNRVVTEEKDY